MVCIVGTDETVYKFITCRNCASRLKYCQADVKRWLGKDYSGGAAGQEWIVCPGCHEEVIIKSW